MKKLRLAGILAISLAASQVFAIEILKREPGKGNLKAGAVVYVDDGTCGSAKIKRVVGGNASKGEGRKTSCVIPPK